MNLEPNGHFKIKLKSDEITNLTLTNFFTVQTNISTTSATSHYELFLPVVFIIVFMSFLFLVYAFNNLNLKSRLIELCCFISRRKNRNAIRYPSRIEYINRSNRQSIYWRPPNQNPLNNYEETNSGFYKVPRIDLFSAHNNANFKNHNYEQIYSTHPSNMILALQGHHKLNKIYQSEDTTGYTLPSIDNLDYNKNYINNTNTKVINNYVQSNRAQNYYHIGNLRSERVSRSIDIDFDMHSYRKYIIRRARNGSMILRRSYSNSRLDLTRWKKQIEKKNQFNSINNWPTKIMSEFELKKFLANENMLKSQTDQILKKNFSESLLQVNIDQSSVSGINNLYNQRINETLPKEINFTSQNDNDNSKPQINLQNSTECNKKRYSITKSYSGLLTSNKELSIYFDNQNIDTLEQNKSEFIDKNKSILSMKTQSKPNLNNQKCYSSIFFNLSEINDTDKNKKKFYKDPLRQRSSTFKALDNYESIKNLKENTFTKLSNKLKDLSNESNIIKNICKEIKLASMDKDMEKNQKSTKYSRLCKSFTFLSQRVTENILLTKKQSQTYTCENKSSPKKKIFSSEPTKLGSFSLLTISFKPGQMNYLKNINIIKSKGFLSMNSILEKVENVSTWKKIRENKDNLSFVQPIVQTEVIKPVTDVAVQTSIVTSESSSFNSHGTTLQTNNFGSILGNFGSASIHFSQSIFQPGGTRLRAYSDGNGLSDLSRNNSYAKNSSSLGTHSASSSKLIHLKIQI